MPNRIIKESICTSENIDQLTEFQEVFFYRLMVNCDDFGRFDARPKLLSSRLFPLRDVTTGTVTETLEALRDADLIILYEVEGHPYLQMKTWEKHQQARATKSRYPSVPDSELQPDDISCNQLQSNDINFNQAQSDDSKCHRNRIRNRNRNTIIDNDNRESRAREDAAAADPMIAPEEAEKIKADHDRVLDAAEDAGFKMSNTARAKLIDMYTQHGIEKVLAGIDSCVKHGAPNLAYLEGCMKESPKPRAAPALPVHAYEQRDYSGEQDAAMERMMAWNKGEAHGSDAAGA